MTRRGCSRARAAAPRPWSELLPERRLVLARWSAARTGIAQGVERRHRRHVAHAGARPGLVDHGRERAGLQVARRARCRNRASALAARSWATTGRQPLTLAALETPRESAAVDRHRRGEAPDVDGRLEGVARQAPGLPGCHAGLEALRLFSLGREQERRPHVELRQRRERAEREDARDEHVGSRAQGDVVACRRTSARGSRARCRGRCAGRRGRARSARRR